MVKEKLPIGFPRGRLARTSKEKGWRRRNAKAIAQYNRRVEREGVFSDGLRSF